MKVTPDTNVLQRLIVSDDVARGLAAHRVRESAAQVAIRVHALGASARVLRDRSGMPRAEIAAAIRGSIAPRRVVTGRPVAQAGPAMPAAGGDCADGVPACEGRRSGGETVVPFDGTAVKRRGVQGVPAPSLTSEADAR